MIHIAFKPIAYCRLKKVKYRLPDGKATVLLPSNGMFLDHVVHICGPLLCFGTSYITGIWTLESFSQLFNQVGL